MSRTLALFGELTRHVSNAGLGALVIAGVLSIVGCGGGSPRLNAQAALGTQGSTAASIASSNPSEPFSSSAPSTQSSTTPGSSQSSSGSGSSQSVPSGPTINPAGPLPAFPGAQGGGAASVGGRGGQAMEVTNLNDSGTGSFRACAEGSGARTCIFRVAGIITLSSGIHVVNPYLTVAGQSAPGGGIEIDGHQIRGGDNDIFVQTHDVIFRYIRVRVGNSGSHSPGPLTGVMCLWVGNGDVYNVMLDHLSMSWSDNKDISPYNNSGTAGVTRSYTTSWSIMSESIQPHSTGFMTGNVNGMGNSMTDIDIHHTLFAHIDHRNPLLKNKTTRFVNNLIFDWVFYAFQGLGGLQADAIANKFKAGPSTQGGIHEFQISNSTAGGDTSTGTPTLYLSGNIGPDQSSSTGNQWVMASEITGENGGETGAVRSTWQRSTPLADPTFPIAVDDVNNLDNVIPASVGASQRLDCQGNWVNMRDSYDTRILNDYANGNYSNGGIPTTNSSTVYPTIDPGTPCASTAHDGLPDAWKVKFGFNPTDNIANTVTMNGFTYLENYLNGTDPTALVLARLVRPIRRNFNSLAEVAVGLLTSRLQFSSIQDWLRTSMLTPGHR